MSNPSAASAFGSIRHKVFKCLVIIADTNEKSSSRELEQALRPLLRFPCMFQVASDPLSAYDLTRSLKYDIIIIPQQTSVPFDASTLMEILRTSDGDCPPFVFLLDRDEIPKRIRGSRSKYVRYTQSGNIPLHDLGEAISSCVLREEDGSIQAFPAAISVTAVPVEVTPMSPHENLSRLTMRVPRLPPQDRSAARRPVALATVSQSPSAAEHHRSLSKRTRSDADEDSEDLPAHAAPTLEVLPPGQPQEGNWVMMQWHASQTYQQRFSPPPRRVPRPDGDQTGRMARSPRCSAAALPVSPERGTAVAAQEAPPLLRSPPLTVFRSGGVGQRHYARDLNEVLRGQGDGTAVDPELVRILSAAAETATALDMDGTALSKMFDD